MSQAYGVSCNFTTSELIWQTVRAGLGISALVLTGGTVVEERTFLSYYYNDTVMSFEDAVKQTKDGVVIDFEVTPGAKSTIVPSGYSVWRKRVEVKLRSPPEKGRANEELIEALSDIFKVPSSGIEITSGATNSRKSIKLHGVTLDAVISTLRGLLS
jgi:uncharacterized protein (TIGR00251 family)